MSYPVSEGVYFHRLYESSNRHVKTREERSAERIHSFQARHGYATEPCDAPLSGKSNMRASCPKLSLTTAKAQPQLGCLWFCSDVNLVAGLKVLRGELLGVNELACQNRFRHAVSVLQQHFLG